MVMIEYGNDFINCKMILDKIEFLEKIIKRLKINLY